MMDVPLVDGWRLECEWGADWSFVRIVPPDEGAFCAFPIAQPIWDQIAAQSARRVIVELERLRHLTSHLLGELVRLSRRLHTLGGVVRLCGIGVDNAQVLRMTRLGEVIESFATREEATRA